MKDTNKYLISIIGPTAIGKTALSIKLANYFNTEIISADSRQFFKEMTIGTAAPTTEELAAAKHHFIHNRSITEAYNVGTFEKEAISCLQELHKTKDVVIMVGGSGLYVDAVTKGLDYFPEVDKSIRAQLNSQLETEGLEALQLKLKLLDEVSYNTIKIDNPQRVIRALEICIGSGQPYASFLNKDKNKRPFKTITIGLEADRAIIYDRINKRVEIMVDNGLINEVKALVPFKHLNSLNTVGYKEIFNYLDNTWTLDFAISEIQKNSRRFAKRQLTWFRRDPSTIWFDYLSPIETITSKIETILNKKNPA
ncbi:tRNA (adenosine(37)-N6)-dimethylallyltransferase MiaA [Psychroserpens sp. NJDZ02]|uniref:tRNA (adenosine(37)-N6)-dimethylallyltransferase MiaA n=1 Tax=Psychroserpens sp. NJDZ02 TaxID=2570561 RepID=UPI0010A8F2B7|nr:tRNA (adenosine(37)-N6)-dimethylallyltransferase MiaA [Psychroserpens sp. NJDZ02]QCE43404.1 tRNA (adenosine(37)-N6)-dimethylallyltransferase MiaA [Psychroserpens sp. NJDZ02]